MDSTTGIAARRDRLPILALVVSNTVSLIGSSLTLIALPWFVLLTTGSATRTGLTGFSVALPAFLVGIFGGTIVDRLGYRRASVIADVVSGVGIGLVPLLFFTVGLPFSLLLALVFLGSMLAIPGISARRALLPELASLADVRLERVNAAFESSNELSLLVGPPLAGLLIVSFGAGTALFIDAASFLVSAVAVLLFVPSFKTQRTADDRQRYREQLVDGLRFLLHEPVLRAMAIGLGIFNGFLAPVFVLFLPVYANRTLGSAPELGLMISAIGLGSLAGMTVYGAVGHRLSHRALWFAAFLVTPGYYWVLAARPVFPVLLLIFTLIGFVWGPLAPLSVTIRHERIPVGMRGRVFATCSAIGRVAEPLGMVLGGVAITTFGFDKTVIAMAITAQIVALGMFAVPALRAIDERVCSRDRT